MKTTELAQTVSTIVDLLLSTIPGVRPDDALNLRASADKIRAYDGGWGRLFIQYDQGWACSASLSVNFMFDEKGENFTVETEMSWGSSSYKLEAARKAATLHAAVVGVAEGIELRFNK